MTLMIILGGAAALYLIWLLFRLAAFALPVYAAIGAGLFVHEQGYGIAATLLAGFATGLIVHLAGQAAFASVRSPLFRCLLALLFAVPAGFAGYYATSGLLALLINNRFWEGCLAIAGGLATAVAAWRTLSGTASEPAPSQHRQSDELNPSAPSA